MNAPYFNTFTEAIAQPGHNNSADDQMEQIQDLLIGDHKRDTERRLAELDARIRDAEARLTQRLTALEAKLDTVVAELKGQHSAGETAILHRIQTVDARVGTIAGALHAGHRAAFDALSQGVNELRVSEMNGHSQPIAKP